MGFKTAISDLKKLKPKISKAKFSIKIGLKEIFLNFFSVVIISTLLPFLFKSKIFEVDFKKVNYTILPEFNKLEFLFDGNFKISIKSFEIIKLLIKKFVKNFLKNRKVKKAYTNENLAL
jgi:hypothetical protein